MKNLRYYVYWLLDVLRGAKIKGNLNESKNLMNLENVQEWQVGKINALLSEASAHCSFYKEYSKYNRLSECPIINKETIKSNYEDILSDKYDRNTLHKMSTSGSTGTPFEILQNKEKRQRVLAELIYFNSILGQNIGDKYIFYRVWNEKNKKSKLEQIKQNLLPVNITRLDDENLKNIVDVLTKDKKLRSTLAYANTYDMIYKYCCRNNIRQKTKVKAMISSSEVLSDETRDGLEERLGCRVANRYSNQECGVIAQSDMTTRKLRINNASYVVEVLNINDNNPAPRGTVGRIVITDLFNYAMPLIRYDTGDLGIVSEEADVYAFDSIAGRRVDLIYDTKGRALSAHTWSIEMWKYDKLRQYQFIQDGAKDYTLKVNGAEGIYAKEDFDSTLRSILGEDANITIEFVDEIPVVASGKFKKTICNYTYNENDYK